MYMATAQQIRKAYLDYVLTNNEKPKSVYTFEGSIKNLKLPRQNFINFMLPSKV